MTTKMQPASEFRRDLKAKNPGLSALFVDRLVKSEIDAGNVEDDGAKGLLANVPTDALVKSAKEIEDALGITPPDGDPIAKSADFGKDAIGRLDFVESLSKSAAGMVESVVDYQRDVFPVLLRAQQAQGMTVQGLTDAISGLAGMLDGLQKGLAEVKAEMKQPIAPGGRTAEGGGRQPLAHPSEQPAQEDPLQKGASGAQQPAAKVTAINAAVLRDRLKEHREDLLQKGGAWSEDHPHKAEVLKLGSAVAALEAGENSGVVIKKFGIKFEAATGT